MNNDKYQKRLEELGEEELKSRVQEVGKVVKERASYHANNIIAQLISEKFDRYNIDEICSSIDALTKSNDHLRYVNNGIIDPLLAKKLQNKWLNPFTYTFSSIYLLYKLIKRGY